MNGTDTRFTRKKNELTLTPTKAIKNGEIFKAAIKYDGTPKMIEGSDGGTEGWIETDEAAAAAVTVRPLDLYPSRGHTPFRGRAPDSTEILASRAPTLAQAIRIASTKVFVILDGTPLPIDRIVTDRPFYSGKHKEHGMNVQVITDPAGRLLWASPALPGAVHDIKAARTHVTIDALAKARVQCWADKGYRGSGGTIRLPYWGRWRTLSTGQQAVNRSHAEIRALVEQAMATLKTWRLLRKLRCSTTRITDLVKAVLALELAVSTRGRKEPHRSALLS